MENQTDESAQKQLKQSIEFILQECRMVLPGIQALFGFQLIAVFSDRFFSLSSPDRFVHLAAILFTVASVGLLIGPAAYHRQASPNGLPPELCKIGTRLVCMGLGTLMISTSLEIFLITKIISEDMMAGVISGIVCLLFLSAIWFVFPWVKHGHSQEKKGLIINPGRTEFTEKSANF